jgi:pimeloyl-ACP methyl ester carboxylesterase
MTEGPQGDFADLPGGLLWFLDTGGPGIPVVFVHANTGTSESWLPQLEFFAAHGYRAIAFDRRGWGRSPVSMGDSGTVSADLDALAAELGLGAFHLVGTAGGAFAALDHAAWRPTALRSLVLAATMGPLDEDEVRAFAARIRIDAPELRARPELRELSAGYRGSDPDGTRRWIRIARAARRLDGAPQPPRTPNTYAKLGTINCPVLAVAGGADLLAPPAMTRLWASRLAARVEVVPEAGHAIAWEQPARFNELVLTFAPASHHGDR